jgi:hypothetical protein
MNKFKSISVNVFCFIFSLCLESQSAEKKIGDHNDTGYAKVRIWNSDISNRIAGHVSLQTDISYISLWPDSSHETVRKLNEVTPNLSEFFELGFVLDAPAIGMTNYQQDIQLENGKEADHSYTIKINTKTIDDLAIKLLREGEYRYSEDHSQFIFNENYRWYAPGSQQSFQNVLDVNKKYLNCASSVVLALLLGEVNPSYFERMYNFKKLQSTGLSLLSQIENQEQKTRDTINELSELSKVILPGDVKYILDLKLTDYFEKELNSICKLNSIEVKSISEYLIEKNLLKDESKNCISILKKANLIEKIDGKNKLVFNKIIKQMIDQKQKIKSVGEAVIITGAIAGGAYVLHEIANKNNCIIL